MKSKYAFLLVCMAVILVSCKQSDLFEKNTTIPDHSWKSDFVATGQFNITDTISAYKIYLVLRHTDAYPYNNIWLNVGFQQPGDTMHFQKLDIRLGDDANGWEGSGMNDIWEVRKIISGDYRFKRSGEYRFNIKQIMRSDPLPEIMSAGLRIEKKI